MIKSENLTDKQLLYFDAMSEMTKDELEKFITAMENDDSTALVDSISLKRWEVIRTVIAEKRRERENSF